MDGQKYGSDAVWREVFLARRAKPVVASMGDYAASGGYYLAMGADAIVAEPGTITGSIGVFSGKLSLRGLYAKLGVSQDTVRRGRHATLFSSWDPWTEEERVKVRGLNESFYETFVSKAAEGRKKTVAEIEAVAQGRVWTGAEAEVRLVDWGLGAPRGMEQARIPRTGGAAPRPAEEEGPPGDSPGKTGRGRAGPRRRAPGGFFPALGECPLRPGTDRPGALRPGRSLSRRHPRQLP
jgi:signal peptide peptidase SppA